MVRAVDTSNSAASFLERPAGVLCPQTAAGKPTDTTFGRGLAVEGDVARWHECPAVDMCSTIERQRPRQDLIAIEHVGQVTLADAGPVDVLKLTLAPGRKYVVPYTNPVKFRSAQ
jgi:hypothetical protein